MCIYLYVYLYNVILYDISYKYIPFAFPKSDLWSFPTMFSAFPFSFPFGAPARLVLQPPWPVWPTPPPAMPKNSLGDGKWTVYHIH